MSRWKHRLIPLYRLAVVLVIFASIHVMQRKRAATPTDSARLLAEARMAFPETAAIGRPVDDFFPLLNASGEAIGSVTRTLPQAAAVTGYNGPSDLLVFFDPDHRVRSVRPWSSSDTAGHVDKIKGDDSFWRQWNGKAESELGSNNPPVVVSGATLTSQAMARGLAARFGAKGMDEQFPDPLTLPEIQPWYPSADRLDEETPGVTTVRHGGEKLGTVLRSARMGVSERGFNGPNDVLVGLDTTSNIVLGVLLKGTRDNAPYTSDTREDLRFTDAFARKRVADILATDEATQWTVSGATVTSGSISASVREMLRRHQATVPLIRFDWKTPLACTWIGCGLLLGLTRLRANRHLRLAFALASMAIGGLILSLMIGQDQLIAWAKRGELSSISLPLLLLSAAAILIPVTTGKNLYCAHLCPHGAAQTLLGGLLKKRHALPARLHLILRAFPWLTLLGLWLLAFLGSGLPLANAEPFEIWSAGFYALVPTLVFGVGLLAAVFLPQGYCHYGCPTGALLKFLSHAPGRWLRRDTAAGLLALIGAAWSLR